MASKPSLKKTNTKNDPAWMKSLKDEANRKGKTIDKVMSDKKNPRKKSSK